MKNYIIFIISLLILSCSENKNTIILTTYFFNDTIDNYYIDSLCSAQTNADFLEYGIPTVCEKVLYSEDFSGESTWHTENDSRYNFKISSGKYIGECEDINFYVRCNPCNSISADNFQIEVEIKILRSGNTCSINWGSNNERDEVWRNTFRFGINGNGEYIIAQNENGEVLDSPVPRTYSPHIKAGAYNKLTIRKVEDVHYFFINEELVEWLDDLKLYGDHISLRVGANSRCEFDNLVYFEIVR